jgi:hypothetical protein
LLSIDTRKQYRLEVFKKDKMWNVVKPQYVVDCLEARDVLPLEPKYMYVTLNDKKEEFSKVMDEYGDDYTKYVNENSIKEVHNDSYHFISYYLSNFFCHII